MSVTLGSYEVVIRHVRFAYYPHILLCPLMNWISCIRDCSRLVPDLHLLSSTLVSAIRDKVWSESLVPRSYSLWMSVKCGEVLDKWGFLVHIDLAVPNRFALYNNSNMRTCITREHTSLGS